MNYITKLKADNAAAEREIAALRTGIAHLKGYLASTKFRCDSELDGYVNINDINSRLESLCSVATEARDTQTAMPSEPEPTPPIAQPYTSWSPLMIQALRNGATS